MVRERHSAHVWEHFIVILTCSKGHPVHTQIKSWACTFDTQVQRAWLEFWVWTVETLPVITSALICLIGEVWESPSVL